ncbi:MAG: TIGR03768 family metallophosphoesterase [Syntrophobacteraceae bacterium]
MHKGYSENGSVILSGDDLKMVQGVNRRQFLKYSNAIAAVFYLNPILSKSATAGASAQVTTYPIDPNVFTTRDRTLVFRSIANGLRAPELPLIARYATYGYGNYTSGAGIANEQRTDLMPSGYRNPSPVRLQQLSSFFSISDIHITDKESPNQMIYLQQHDPTFYTMGSIYSPVMLYTTHVLDAAIQTINALHKKTPFDFGISLGDACNSSQHNEIRWYIDVIDGKVITPCSGVHLGMSSIDYQKPFKAAGLDKSIPWYQTLGNHDHFWIGTFPVDADSSLGLRDSYTTGNVMACGELRFNLASFPCMFDVPTALKERTYYMGVLDGSTPHGNIIDAGSYAAPPTVPADPGRHRVTIAEWKQEFFNTTTNPVGHGFGLVDPSRGSDFACYSFVPSSHIPLKIIVLDDTQSETDGSHDIHGHGFLDATRWRWLQAELAAGQAANQLMIIAAHIPIGVGTIGSEVEWWESEKDCNATEHNAVSLTGLVNELWNTPNLLMWIAGHRHVNTIKAFVSPDRGNAPQKGFWHVETSSLRDFPQQFRTFQIYLNSDYSVSIVTTNVDPSVAEGTPAAASRASAIAAQQILQINLTLNAPNLASLGKLPLETLDPSRAQDGTPDATIKWPQVPGYGPFPSLQSGQYSAPVYNSNAYPSCNAELFKQLSPAMVALLKERFPGKKGGEHTADESDHYGV